MLRLPRPTPGPRPLTGPQSESRNAEQPRRGRPMVRVRFPRRLGPRPAWRAAPSALWPAVPVGSAAGGAEWCRAEQLRRGPPHGPQSRRRSGLRPAVPRSGVPSSSSAASPHGPRSQLCCSRWCRAIRTSLVPCHKNVRAPHKHGKRFSIRPPEPSLEQLLPVCWRPWRRPAAIQQRTGPAEPKQRPLLTRPKQRPLLTRPAAPKGS